MNLYQKEVDLLHSNVVVMDRPSAFSAFKKAFTDADCSITMEESNVMLFMTPYDEADKKVAAARQIIEDLNLPLIARVLYANTNGAFVIQYVHEKPTGEPNAFPVSNVHPTIQSCISPFML